MPRITPKDVVESMSVLPRLFHTLMGRFEPGGDFNPSEMQVLMKLTMHSGAPMSTYSKQLGLRKGSFTAVADKLEAKGLIERRADETDRRRVTLVLTAQGEEQALRMRNLMESHMAERLAIFDEDQLGRLNDALKMLDELAQELEGNQ